MQVTDDVVVLAVPYLAISGVLQQLGATLAGKVLVDITNPLNFETFDSLIVPADSSATAEIAAPLAESRVDKALNTTSAATWRQGRPVSSPPCSSRWEDWRVRGCDHKDESPGPCRGSHSCKGRSCHRRVDGITTCASFRGRCCSTCRCACRSSSHRTAGRLRRQ